MLSFFPQPLLGTHNPSSYVEITEFDWFYVELWLLWKRHTFQSLLVI